MTRAGAERNIQLYQWYLWFAAPLFWGSTLMQFLQEQGNMTLSEIFAMEAAAAFLLALCEVITGSLADHIGRKKTMLIGRVLLLLETIVIITSTNNVGMWIGNFIWAVGFSFCSGADSALLYDSLKVTGETHRMSPYLRRSEAIRYLIVAFCALPTGLLYAIDRRLPMLISIPGMIISIVITSRMYEAPRSEEYSPHGHLAILRQGIHASLIRSDIRWIIVFCAIVGIVLKTWFFTYNNYYQLVGLPMYAYGITFFVLNIIAAMGYHIAAMFERNLQGIRAPIFVVTGIVIPVLAMGLFPHITMVSMIFASNIVRGFHGPFFSAMMHDRIDSETRATVESFESAVRCLLETGSNLVMYVIVALLSIPSILIFLGVAMLLIGGWQTLRYRKMVESVTPSNALSIAVAKV